MSKLKTIWENKWLILAGVWNKLFKKQYVEKIAKQRMDICNKCVQLDTTGENCLWEGSQPCCSECGCSLEFKTRSLSSECPLKYWAALEKDNE